MSGGDAMKTKRRRARRLPFLIWLGFLVLGLYVIQAVFLRPQANLFNMLVPVVLLAWLAVAGVIALVQSIVMPMVKGIGCPKCSEATLERVSVQSFGARYFQCSACRGRFKRSSFSAWEEVTDPDEAALFDPAERDDSFEIERWSEDDASPGVKSIDSLVRNQRRRKDAD
jgi:hypothetical protein